MFTIPLCTNNTMRVLCAMHLKCEKYIRILFRVKRILIREETLGFDNNTNTFYFSFKQFVLHIIIITV